MAPGLDGDGSCSVASGVLRAARFWATMLPIISAYKGVDKWMNVKLVAAKKEFGSIENGFGDAEAELIKAEAKRRRENLHAEMAPRLLSLILDLRGVYLKVGQVCSMLPVVPLAYRTALKVLQNGVPPKPAAEVRALVEAALGRPIDTLFQHFEDQPVGSASVAQVHRATTLTGQPVAVKVQYAEVRRNFESDLAQVQAAVQMLAPSRLEAARHSADVIMLELDFEREAKMMSTVADSMATMPEVAVPRPVEGMVRPTVLVMTWLPGETLLDGIERLVAQTSAMLGVPAEELKRTLLGMKQPPAEQQPAEQQKLEQQQQQPAAPLEQRDATSGLSSMLARLRLMITLRRQLRSNPLAVSVLRYLQLLVRALGHQLLRTGCYSSDPHPGNLLMLPDGRLGLLDFGQSGTLDAKQRLWLARTFLAIAGNDESALATLAAERGMRTKHNLPQTLAFHLRMPMDTRPVANLLAEAERHRKSDPLEELGDGALALPFRPIVLVQAICRAFGWPISMAHEFSPLARQVISERGMGSDAPLASVPQATRPRWAAVAPLLAAPTAMALVAASLSASAPNMNFVCVCLTAACAALLSSQ